MDYLIAILVITPWSFLFLGGVLLYKRFKREVSEETLDEVVERLDLDRYPADLIVEAYKDGAFSKAEVMHYLKDLERRSLFAKANQIRKYL